MSATTPTLSQGQGLNPPPQHPQPPHNMNPMQQLRPLTLPPHPTHSAVVPHPQQYQQMPQQISQQQHDHISAYYNQSGANTPVATNPGVGLGGATFPPGASTQYSGPHQAQPGAVTTPTSAVSGVHHFQGIPGVPGNGACFYIVYVP